MLSTGVPLLASVRLCRESVGNRLFRTMLNTIETDVLDGAGIGRALINAPFLPAGAAQMVSTAEQTGNLSEVLKMVGEHFEHDGERRLRELVKLMEPGVIVVLGFIVSLVVMAVVLPLLEISTGGM